MMSQFTKLALFSTSTFILFCGPSHASDVTPYIKLGLGVVQAEGTHSDEPWVTSAVLGGGVEIGRFFGVEAEGQFGIGGKEREFFGGSVTRFELDSQLGIYGVGRLPVSNAASLHLRAGYASYKSSTETEAVFDGESFGTETIDFELGGFSLGFGGQYVFGADQLNGIRLDSYTIIDVDESPDDSETSLPDITGTFGVSLSYLRKF